MNIAYICLRLISGPKQLFKYCKNDSSGKQSDLGSLLNASINNFSGLKYIKRGYIEMTKKIYLVTFEKCPRSLCFPLLFSFKCSLKFNFLFKINPRCFWCVVLITGLLSKVKTEYDWINIFLEKITSWSCLDLSGLKDIFYW